MKRILILVGLLFSVATSVGRAQTRVGVSLSFGDPYFAGQVLIGRPYYRPYYREGASFLGRFLYCSSAHLPRPFSPPRSPGIPRS